MLHTDVHSHILPGIDDGARDITVSEGIINRLFSQGVEYIAATPHFRSHRETVEQFSKRRRKAYEQLCRHFSYDVMKRITVAAEVALEFGLSDDKSIKELTYGSTNYILLELPFRQFSQRMIEEITNIQYDYGLIPVIAHIDRYTEIFSQDEYDMLLSLNGVIFQINNSAFLERSTRRLVSRLIEEDLPFVLGSDSHDTGNRAPDFDAAVRPIGDYKPHPDARRFLDALKTAGIEYLDSVYNDDNVRNIRNTGINAIAGAGDMRELTNSVRKISDSLRMNETSDNAEEERAPEPYIAKRQDSRSSFSKRAGYIFSEDAAAAVPSPSPTDEDPGIRSGGAEETTQPENRYHSYSSYGTHETAHDSEGEAPSYRKPNNIRVTSESDISVKSFLPLLYFLAAAIIFSFVLPKLGLFSHVIDVSASDVYTVSDSLVLGDEGADVTALQKKLYTLGYLDFDGLTGRFDETTISAVNAVLERKSMKPVINCSRENYEMLLALTPQELVSGSDAHTEPEKEGNGGADESAEQTRISETTSAAQTATTTSTTVSTAVTATTTTTSAAEDTTTEPEKTTTTVPDSHDEETDADNSNKIVRILEDGTRLRSRAKMKSKVMFWVNRGDEYEYLGEETDDEGTKWYKIQYKDVYAGYVLAEQTELIDKQ